MWQTSELYKRLWDAGADVETKVEIETENGTFSTFGEDVLISMSTEHNLFSDNTPAVGCAVSGEINLEMLLPSVTFKRMGRVRPYVRLTNGTEHSEWIPRGVFFIDTRRLTRGDMPTITLHGYDSMMKAEQIYGTAASGKTMRGIVLDIASKIGVTVLNADAISNSWTCEVDTTLTMREYLKIVAAANCGNFVFDYLGRLRFVRFTHLPARPVVEFLADENNNVITFGGTSIVITKTVADGVHYVGKAMQQFDYAPAFQPYSKVVVIVDQEGTEQTVYEAGTDGGRELTVGCVYGTQAIADFILSQVNGFAYQPVESSTTILDPSAELGDGIFGNEIYTGIYGISTNFDRMCASTVEAPADEEIDHEYNYSDNTTKMERKISKTNASLRVLSGEIESKIDSETAQSLIDQTIDEITLSVTSGANGSSISLTSKGVTITSDEVNIEANSINLSTATISGKLTATNIDASELHVAGANIDNLEVTNAMIASLDVSKLYINGSPMYAVSGNQVTTSVNTVVPTLRSTGGIYAGSQIGIGSSGEYSVVYLTSDGIQINGGASASWADILTKTYTAKFG